MATKTAFRPARTVALSRNVSHALKLRKLMDKQQVLAQQLQALMEDLEEAEENRLLDKAIKRNAGKPGVVWSEAKKRLGLD